jgi:hypothetical protein
MAHRMTWDEICSNPECKGRWIALHGCSYDDSGRAAEGDLVDIDADLAELCNRVRDAPP